MSLKISNRKNSPHRRPGLGLNLKTTALLAVCLFAVGANAQTQLNTDAVGQNTPQSAVESAKGAPLVDDAKKNLQDLLSYYQRDADRIAKENGQLKELYDDGLIARLELEANDRLLADAKAKVEDMRRQVEAKPTKQIPLSDGLESAAAWTSGNPRIDTLIRDHGNLYGVDPYLIYCVMAQESSFNSSAVSPKGARGLMQLMPGTAARYGVVNVLDPQQSIRGGTRYLKDLLKLFDGRVDLTLAAYNAGEGAVIKYGNAIPPYAETQSYVRLISKRYLNKNRL